MRKQQIEKIAEAIKDARNAGAPKDYKQATTHLEQQELIVSAANHSRIFDSLSRTIADAIASETARFQRSKFLAQCGVERP